GAGAGAPAPRSLRNRPMPIQQAARGQLDDERVAEIAEDIMARHAFDAVGGLAATATIVVEIVRHGARDRVRAGTRRCNAACQPLLICRPLPGRALGLREVEDAFAVGILEIIGEGGLGLSIECVLVSPR